MRIQLGVIVGAALACAASVASADEGKCRIATLKAAAQQARAVVSALAGCEARIIADKLPLGTDCQTEAKAAKVLAKWAEKTAAAIAKGCGGKDKQCDGDPGPEGDVPLAAAGWGATCPDLDQYGCTNPLGHCGDVHACLLCAARTPLLAAHESVHGALLLPNTKQDKARSKCQQAISKSTAKLFVAAAGIHEKCWTALAKEKAGFASACPAGDASGKTTAALAGAAAKAVAAICKVCGGADKECGGGDDQTPAAIGFAEECRPVTTPGGAACGVPITSLADVATCTTCIAQFEAACTLALAAPFGGAYPLECSPPILGDDPSALFTDAASDFDRTVPYEDDEVSPTPEGAEIIRTHLEITFEETATAGEVAALLEDYDARILRMLEDVPLALVLIPDPGSLAALDAVIAALEAEPIVVSASRDGIPETQILPPQYVLPAGASLAQQPGLSLIDHLLAVRAAAAWHVRPLLFRPVYGPDGFDAPQLVVGDAFGDGKPESMIALNIPFGFERDFAPAPVDKDRHGYQMLGVIADDFGSSAGCLTALPDDPTAIRRCATGIFPAPPAGDALQLPAPIRLRAVDLQYKKGWASFEFDLAVHIKGTIREGDVPIVNTSLGYAPIYGQPAAARIAAREWIAKVKGYQNDFLHVTPAGNFKAGGATDAATNNPFTAAALLGGLTDEKGFPLANLPNVIVVENRRAGGFPLGAGNLGANAKRGGDVSAIGVDIFTSSSNAPNQTASGSSFASAQVAGLALYLAFLDPKATPARLKQLILETARPVPGRDGPKVIDAYGSVMRAADTDLTAPAKAPARVALLDLVQSAPDTFDAVDVQAFFTAFAALPGDAARIHSRVDLRGRWAFDTPFDLNLDGAYGPVQQQIGPDQAGFIEEAIGFDEEILCYYVFSPLYTRATANDEGEKLCCEWLRANLRLPATAVCPPPRCPGQGGQLRFAARDGTCPVDQQPTGSWNLFCGDGMGYNPGFALLEDGTMMEGFDSATWRKTGTWTTDGASISTSYCPVDPFTGPATFTFEGTWSPAPVPPEFGVVSCAAAGCPAMKGTLTQRDRLGQVFRTVECDSRQRGGARGYHTFADPRDQQCHGGCFERYNFSWPHLCKPDRCSCANYQTVGCTPDLEHGTCPDELVCRPVIDVPDPFGFLYRCVPEVEQACTMTADCPAGMTCCPGGTGCGTAATPWPWLRSVCLNDPDVP